jgi:hypothetical protein
LVGWVVKASLAAGRGGGGAGGPTQPSETSPTRNNTRQARRFNAQWNIFSLALQPVDQTGPAFEALYWREKTWIFRHVLCMVGDAPAAEEVFAAVVKHEETGNQIAEATRSCNPVRTCSLRFGTESTAAYA